MICQRVYPTHFAAELIATAIKSKKEWSRVIRLVKGPFDATPEILDKHELNQPKEGCVLEFELLDELPVGPGEEGYTQLANAYYDVVRELGIKSLC